MIAFVLWLLCGASFALGAAFGSTVTRVRVARQLRAQTLQLTPACARYRGRS